MGAALGQSVPRNGSQTQTATITTAISFLPEMKRIFTTPFVVYLGTISYALFLTHGSVNRVFALPFTIRMWNFFGNKTFFKYTAEVKAAFGIYLFISFWVGIYSGGLLMHLL
jgi:peptidoglycan/LPS O-acetylase OafA/YrhL